MGRGAEEGTGVQMGHRRAQMGHKWNIKRAMKGQSHRPNQHPRTACSRLNVTKYTSKGFTNQEGEMSLKSLYNTLLDSRLNTHKIEGTRDLPAPEIERIRDDT